MKTLKILVLAAAVCSFSSLAADNASKDESLGDKMSAIGSNIQKKGAKVGEKISDGAVYTKDKVADGYDYTKGKVVGGYDWTADKVKKTQTIGFYRSKLADSTYSLHSISL